MDEAGGLTVTVAMIANGSQVQITAAMETKRPFGTQEQQVHPEYRRHQASAAVSAASSEVHKADGSSHAHEVEGLWTGRDGERVQPHHEEHPGSQLDHVPVLASVV